MKSALSRKTFLCYVSGGGDCWEAICVDFDISVQGTSIDDVQRRLFDAVHCFVDAARQETPEQAARLLARQAPWSVRASLKANVIWQALRGRRAIDVGQPLTFQLPCPA